jgi:hypothetical protein
VPSGGFCAASSRRPACGTSIREAREARSDAGAAVGASRASPEGRRPLGTTTGLSTGEDAHDQDAVLHGDERRRVHRRREQLPRPAARSRARHRERRQRVLRPGRGDGEGRDHLPLGAGPRRYLLDNPDTWRGHYGDTPCWVFTHHRLPAVRRGLSAAGARGDAGAADGKKSGSSGAATSSGSSPTTACWTRSCSASPR